MKKQPKGYEIIIDSRYISHFIQSGCKSCKAELKKKGVRF